MNIHLQKKYFFNPEYQCHHKLEHYWQISSRRICFSTLQRQGNFQLAYTQDKNNLKNILMGIFLSIKECKFIWPGKSAYAVLKMTMIWQRTNSYQFCSARKSFSTADRLHIRRPRVS